MRVADYVIERLAKEGIGHIFTVTGRGILYLTDAVARCQSMEGVSVHHEQAASYAAYAYAQEKHHMGACLVSTGCAATNAMTGLLCAWQDNVPCIFISGNNMKNETSRFTGLRIRTYGQQENDIISLVEPITKYAVMITDPKQIRYEMDKAIAMATEGRPGPVWIDIPLDVQDGRIEEEKLEGYSGECPSFDSDVKSIPMVAEQLRKAKRPVLLLGSGVRSAGAKEEVEKFATKWNVPITFGASAVDVIGSGESLSIGCVASMGGSRAGNFAVQNADCVLVLGHRLSPMTTSEQYEKFARDAKVIVVDIDKTEHQKETISIDTFIHCDVLCFMKELQKETLTDYSKWLQKCQHWKKFFAPCEETFMSKDRVDLYQLVKCIEANLPENAVVCSDAGIEELIIPTNIGFHKGQRCIHPVSQGAMGFALPAMIGAWYSSQKPVIGVIGDGSVMMNLQELETIAYRQLPIKIIINNNNGYSVIRRRQKNLFRNRTIGNDASDGVGIPSFEKVATCFGITYVHIENVAELDAKLQEVISCEQPVICEVEGVVDQNYIHSSYARTKQKRFASRPLEDQSPFLDRELFLGEMLVEPIDQ